MRLGFITCGALGREVLDTVRKQGWDARVVGTSPNSHLYSTRIAPEVERRILQLKDDCERLIVVYGDCSPRGMLDEVLEKYGVPRPEARNCYEMFAGASYHDLLREEPGTFFLTDFLVRSFHRAVMRELGLDRFPELKDAYFHNCRRVVYLVQRGGNDLEQRARAIADYMELPIKIEHTGCENFERLLWGLVHREQHRFGLPPYRTTCSCKNDIASLML